LLVAPVVIVLTPLNLDTCSTLRKPEKITHNFGWEFDFFERSRQLRESYLIAREANYFRTGSSCGIWLKSAEFEIVLFL
jgi:hypothetical protein